MGAKKKSFTKGVVDLPTKFNIKFLEMAQFSIYYNI
jgi:hypothetical protein